MFLSKKLDFPLKSCRADWCVDFIERIHCKLEHKVFHLDFKQTFNHVIKTLRWLTLMYKSYTSLKKFLIPSSCLTSCSMMNLICTANN